MTSQRIREIREYAERNATGLISPAKSGLIIALALFECADALREQTFLMAHPLKEAKPE